MKVSLIKSCTYHAPPFIFSKANKVKDVPEELGEYLLQTGYFEKIEEDKKVKKESKEVKEEKIENSTEEQKAKEKDNKKKK